MVASSEVHQAVREYSLVAGSAEIELKKARSEMEGEIRKLMDMKERRDAFGLESLALQRKLKHADFESLTPTEKETFGSLDAVESSRREIGELIAEATEKRNAGMIKTREVFSRVWPEVRTHSERVRRAIRAEFGFGSLDESQNMDGNMPTEGQDKVAGNH